MRIDSLSYLPQFIIQNPDIRELLEAEQNEIDMLEDYVELIRDQVFISSASIYLDRYEKMFGLEVNDALSIQERSAKILAKLNTRTNSTVEAIKTVVSSISKCSTDIEEYYDSYTFMIDIIRDNNDIINIEDIKFAVDIIKPAHLAYRIQMCYKMVLGILVKTTIYRVAHDVCSDYGGDLDYCGETPPEKTCSYCMSPYMLMTLKDIFTLDPLTSNSKPFSSLMYSLYIRASVIYRFNSNISTS